MPIFADFDRDGTISRSATEARDGLVPPGAVVVPNLDADTAVASAAAIASGVVPVDADLRQMPPSENDLTEIQVLCVAGAAAGILALREQDLRLVRVYDAAGTLVLGTGSTGSDPFLHHFPASPNAQSFFVEAIRVAGDPDAATFPRTGDVELRLVSVDALGTPIAPAELARLTVAPFLLMHNANAPLVMYICEDPTNEPTRRDVFEAFGISWRSGLSATSQRFRGSRIPCTLATVPLTAHFGDKWVQDQFEVGYFRGADRDLPGILHCPRLRLDFRLQQSGRNLGAFVAGHFARPGMALLQQLWMPQLEVRDTGGSTRILPHVVVMEIEFFLDRLENAYLILLVVEQFARLRPSRMRGEDQFLGTDPGVMLWALRERVEAALATQGNPESGEDADAYRQRLALLQTGLRLRWQEAEPHFALRPDPVPASGPTHVIVRTTTAGELQFRCTPGEVSVRAGGPSAPDRGPVDTIQELRERIERLIGPVNFGGNIEVAPPTPPHPFGQIFVGSPDLGSARFWAFLANQGYQPLVPTTTNWLLVGHIDEILSFAPATSSGSAGTPFVALRASADLALDILLAARRLYLAGLPSNPDHPRTSNELTGRLNYAHANTSEGSHPVTRMLRGKRWAREPGVAPPLLFQRLAELYTIQMRLRTTPQAGFLSPETTTFDASLSIREALHMAVEDNRNIEANFLRARSVAEIAEETADEIAGTDDPTLVTPLEEILTDRLPFIPIERIPVLFDLLDPSLRATVAFLPNMINMQHLGGHVLVPRPYGPRMSPDDAAQVLRPLLPAALRGHASRSYFVRRRLDRVWHWASPHPNLPAWEDDLGKIVELFRDGFPEDMEEEEIARRIRTAPANRGAFRREVVEVGTSRITRYRLNGNFRKLLIPENTVDLFEAYTYVVLRELCGLRVHFVDSWDYHLRLGEIHCGTNVVRRPPRSPKWWDVRQRIPTVAYRGSEG